MTPLSEALEAEAKELALASTPAQPQNSPVEKKLGKWSKEEQAIFDEANALGLSNTEIAARIPGRTPHAVQMKKNAALKSAKTGATPNPNTGGSGRQDAFRTSLLGTPNTRYKMPWTPEQDEKLLRTYWEKPDLSSLINDPEIPSRDIACLNSRRTFLASIRNELYVRVMRECADIQQVSTAWHFVA